MVRQAVPGPCLGNKKNKKQLLFRGRLATVNQSNDEMMDVDMVKDDLPEEDEEEIDGYDTLTGFFYFVYILQENDITKESY